MRSLVGLILTGLGLAVTLYTLTANGWLMVAAIGVGLLALDYYIEKRERRHET